MGWTLTNFVWWSIIFIVHLCFGSHSHGQFLKSITVNPSIKERNDSAWRGLTTGFTLVVMGFCSAWKRQRKTKVFTTFCVTLEELSAIYFSVFCCPLWGILLWHLESISKSIPWFATSFPSVVNNFSFAYFHFFCLMVLISAFESCGVLIKGSMSSSCSVTTLR